MIELQRIKKYSPQLSYWMSVHYSQPKGFVGRSLIYLIVVNGQAYGAIAGGSAFRHLDGRDQFFQAPLNNIVNNIFYHVCRHDGQYPCRNFTTRVVTLWRERVREDWECAYKDPVLGYETLVELPRTGELYTRDGWVQVGTTVGHQLKRVAGKAKEKWEGAEKWNGHRVWLKDVPLRPKRVLVRRPDVR